MIRVRVRVLCSWYVRVLCSLKHDNSKNTRERKGGTIYICMDEDIISFSIKNTVHFVKVIE